MLCMHKTTILCQFGLIICHQLTNSYLHQFSTIFGGNCIMVQPWPNLSVAVIPLSVMHMASNQPNNSSTPSLITSEKGEPWIPSSVMEANMKSPSESLISSIPCSSKIISLNLIINTRTRLKIVLDLPSVTPTLS